MEENQKEEAYEKIQGAIVDSYLQPWECKDSSRTYAKEIRDKSDLLIAWINKEFEERRPEIGERLTKILRNTLRGGSLPHYELILQAEDGLFDAAKKVGTVDLDQTVRNFLNEEYTGDWAPVPMEGHTGKTWQVYAENLCDDVSRIGTEIMRESLFSWLDEECWYDGEMDGEVAFGKEFWWHLSNFLYDNTAAGEFFDPEHAYVFAGLADKPLREFVPEEG